MEGAYERSRQVAAELRLRGEHLSKVALRERGYLAPAVTVEDAKDGRAVREVAGYVCILLRAAPTLH